MKRNPFLSYLKGITGIRPANTELYYQAFRHSSAVEGSSILSNERLEFLGDAVIELIVREYLFNRFHDRNEGRLTTLRVRIVNRDFLNKMGKSLNFDQFIKVGESNKEQLLEEAPSLYGNVLEALVGAVFLDKGYKAAKYFFIDLLLIKHFDIDEVLFTRVDFKSRLLEWSQKHDVQIGFKVMNDPVKEGVFVVGLYVQGEKIIEGTGQKKKKAENEAAKHAFENGMIRD